MKENSDEVLLFICFLGSHYTDTESSTNYCIGSKPASCINLQPNIKTALLMDLSGTLELTWGNGYKVFKR